MRSRSFALLPMVTGRYDSATRRRSDVASGLFGKSGLEDVLCRPLGRRNRRQFKHLNGFRQMRMRQSHHQSGKLNIVNSGPHRDGFKSGL
jgi:hypothetical protein